MITPLVKPIMRNLTRSRLHAAPAFTPADIVGLELWLDASDAATISHVGNKVSQWSDKSGNNNNAAQPNASKRLAFGSDSKGNYLLSTGSGTSTGAAHSWMDLSGTIIGKFIVFVVDFDGTNFSMVLGVNSPGSAQDSYIFLHNSSGYWISLDGHTSNADKASWWLDGAFQKADAGNTGAENLVPFNEPHAYAVSFNNGDPRTPFNMIGAYRGDAKASFGGKIREIISYTQRPSDEQIAQLNQHVIKKWGAS